MFMSYFGDDVYVYGQDNSNIYTVWTILQEFLARNRVCQLQDLAFQHQEPNVPTTPNLQAYRVLPILIWILFEDLAVVHPIEEAALVAR